MDSLCPGGKDAKHLANVLEVWEKHLQRQEVNIKWPMLKKQKRDKSEETVLTSRWRLSSRNDVIKYCILPGIGSQAFLNVDAILVWKWFKRVFLCWN